MKPHEQELHERRRAMRTGAIAFQPFYAAAGPMLFWNSGIPRERLFVWAAFHIVPFVLIVASVESMKRNHPLRGDHLALGFRLTSVSLFGALGWLSVTVTGTSPYSLLLLLGLVLPTFVEGALAMLFVDRNRHYWLYVAIPAISFTSAYVYTGQWGLAFFVIVWAITVVNLANFGSDVMQELHRLRESSEFDARHDSLTGLLNRQGFIEELDEVAAAQSPAIVAVIDLDRFKLLNDALGHQCGDYVLTQIAERLRSALPADAKVSRIGGDEFAAIVPQWGTLDEMGEQVGEALDYVHQPIAYNGRDLLVRASAGVAPLLAEGTPMEQLAEADLSMYQNKRDRSAKVTVFDGTLRQDLEDRIDLEARLREAIDADAIEFWAQPLVDAVTRRPTSIELLARWPQPDGSILLPRDFIPMAEESGLIVDVGRLALAHARKVLDRWSIDPDLCDLSVNVNIAAVHLSTGLVDDVKIHVGDRADRLGIEFVETSLVVGGRAAADLMQQLRDLGVLLYVDDFGVGYSSLTYLWSLPMTSVKVDQSFVRGIEHDPIRRSLLESIAEMASALDMPCVAEGVESAVLIDLMSEIGVDGLQGIGVAPVEPIEVAEATVRRLIAEAGSMDRSRRTTKRSAGEVASFREILIGELDADEARSRLA